MEPKRSLTSLTPRIAVAEVSEPAERRAKKRYTSKALKLTFLGLDHVALNWSADGFLIDDRHPELVVGASVSGVLTMRGIEGRFRFAAELVRRDARTKEIAFKFVNPSRALADCFAQLLE